MSLKNKVELAKTYYGFNKGIRWWWWIRIIFIPGMINILILPIYTNVYGYEFSDSVSFIWILMIINHALFGYGIYLCKIHGYKCILISQIAKPLLNILFIEFLYFDCFGILFMNANFLGTIIADVITCGINIYYFNNRKIL